MSEKKLYLKQNVLLEPLVNQWYAWSFLIPPQTFSLIVENLHLKIMQSFVKSPAMHANASKNPRMLGGPFMNLAGNQTRNVKALLDTTGKRCARQLSFAKAMKEMEDIMANEAKGFTLLPLYQKIPETLMGYVELGYDLHNHPSLRYIESLLYGSPNYDRGLQSLALSMLSGDHRPFVLSTPRFADATHLHYPLSFDNEAIDRLFSMRDTPQSLDTIEEFMPEDAQQREFFMTMFSQEAPELRGRDRESLADQVRVKYFGHACLLFETKDVSIMADPCVSYGVASQSVPRYTYADLPETIDYVLLTHGHQDHFFFEHLLQLRHRIKNIVVPRSSGGSLQDPWLQRILQNTGFKSVIELDELESMDVPGGKITGVPFMGKHGELHIRSKLAYHLELNGKTALCASDSNNLTPELYDEVKDFLGPVDHIFLGMESAGAPMSWLYGPLLFKPLERRMDQTRKMDGADYDRGMAIINSLKVSKGAYVYGMGQEPWLSFISTNKYNDKSKPILDADKLVQACRKKGCDSERLYGRKELMLT